MIRYSGFVQTLTVRCTLKPALEQAEALEATVQLFMEGCNYALRVAKERGEFRRFRLHHLVYKDLRAMGLSANLAVQAIARVGRKKGSRAKFYQPTSVAYDQRTLSLRMADETVSLTTVKGRLRIPLKLGNYQRHLLRKAKSVQGGVLTKGPKGKWYIHLTLRVETPEPPGGGGRVVGVDLGQKALATLSAGHRFSGGRLKSVRLRYLQKRAEVRSKLDRPSERTRGLKRLWARLSGREARFVNSALHALTRRIVDLLEPGDILALEHLTGLRGRTSKRGRKGRHLHNLWPYGRLRFLLEYKARLKGVRVVYVDPRHTSRECPRCGHVSKVNRRSQALFRCEACGFQHNADWVASVNIARRALAQGAGSAGPGHGQLALVLGHRLKHLHLPAS
ncbi:RNA-guided endonuclease InsQ/TnpB family protein [Marinithermus hydrothermalis]|uniref:Transposase, IS605 OrfB family n=1 Tax=Marinithermus hydrothermalis (strain DSM 14884 / JCM 11576 / T1) TaxID=869210 RepID=F2NKS5_MARHT|nr:RNA-guided endonuclease TnpB family protein [Marinithermus hydrothermalis]AEB10838.1 transposase, IS605 OrfB family [Marinithermus hydrothermalis DSM 14884]